MNKQQSRSTPNTPGSIAHQQKGTTVASRTSSKSETVVLDPAFAEFLKGLTELVTRTLGAPAQSAGRSVATADADADEEETGESYTGAKWTLKALRAEAVERGFDEADVRAASKDDLIRDLIADDNGEFDEDGEEGDDEDEADETDEAEEDADEEESEDEDGEEGEDAREDFDDYTLAQLKTYAKENWGWSAADVKGMDKDGILDSVFGEAEEDEGDDEGDDEEEADAWDEDSLSALSRKELLAVAKNEFGISVARGASEEDIIASILEGDDDE